MSGALDTLAVLDAPLPKGSLGLFTTRQGGVSQTPWHELNLGLHVGDDRDVVLANRTRLALQLGDPPLITLDQVHGREVRVISGAAESGSVGVGDALVTAEIGIALAIQVADCLPVLFVDPARRVIGAAHAGRHGLAVGVLQATVAAMVAAGSQAADIVAVIGPGICGACYEVPAELRDEVAASVPGSATTTRQGTPGLDLAAGATGLLVDLGLGAVRRTGICTMEDDRFFSYRRDGVTGRFAGVVMLTDPT